MIQPKQRNITLHFAQRAIITRKLDKLHCPACLLQLFLCGSLYCAAQNQVTPQGLKTGAWVEAYELASGVFWTSGEYEIVPLHNYDIIRSLGEDTYEIRHKGATPLLFLDGRYGDNISVKDGIWQTFNENGSLHKTDGWENGLNAWTKYFDAGGDMIRYEYEDFEHDTSFYLTYKNKRLFKKAFYPPENKNEQVEIYYPDDHLVIPDAEMDFYAILGNNTVYTYYIPLTCKKSLSILSVTSDSDNLRVSLPSKTLPMELQPMDTMTVFLTFMPTPASSGQNTTVTIVTSEGNPKSYTIYGHVQCAHLDNRNVEHVKTLSLSKKADRYLVIAPMGTVTTAYILNSEGGKRTYDIHHNTKIDLNELETGEHHLSIFSCHTGGEVKLTITE